MSLDPKDFQTIDEHGNEIDALWLNIGNDQRVKSLKLEVVDKITDTIHEKIILEQTRGFEMKAIFDDIDSVPEFRSDIFTTEHGNKRHMLTAGCSITFGLGLLDDERWQNLVYDKINTDNSFSGLFCLAQDGDSLQNQMAYILDYCSKYSMPELILFNIPDFWRIPINDHTYKVYAGDRDNQSSDLLANFVISHNVKLYSMLEKFCKINNINLVSFSWHDATSRALKNFDTFIYIDNNKIVEKMYPYRDLPFALMARDAVHPGTARHKAWADIVLDKLNGLGYN